jgi:hypothetical protein
MLVSLLATLVLAAPPSGPRPHQRADEPELKITVDSARHTVTFVAGPFAIDAGHPPSADGAMNHGMHVNATEYPLMYFKWPVAGWARGFQLQLVDGQGKEVDRRLLHHLNIVNFGRRQLFYPVPERMLAIGQETPDISLPKTVGIPVEAGFPMALIMAWHNEKLEPVPVVYVHLTMDYSPTNMNPRPVSVMPVYMDVVDPIGKEVDFDLPAGNSTFTGDHALVASGRIIGIGGHGHDFLSNLALQEVVDSTHVRNVATLRTTRDSTGRLLGIEQKLPGIRGNGIPLQAGKTYRVTGSYENPTGRLLVKGAMIHIILLYAVTDMRQWPKVDADDPGWRLDMEWMDERGSMRGDPSAAHHH